MNKIWFDSLCGRPVSLLQVEPQLNLVVVTAGGGPCCKQLRSRGHHLHLQVQTTLLS